MNLADEKKKAVSSPSTSVASPGPVVNQLDDIARETFATGRPLEDSPDLQQCKHCKKSILKTAAKAHIAQCLKLKKEKAQRKKEARKLDEENGDDDSDDDDKKGSVAGKKAGKKPEEEKKGGKKRKADGEPDKGPKAKKKKDEPKAKVPKPKGLNSNGSPLSRITSISCLTDLILQGRSMSKDNVVSYSPMDNLVLDRLRARATPWEQSVLSQVVPFPTICF
jgi:SAGA-associated factor 73